MSIDALVHSNPTSPSNNNNAPNSAEQPQAQPVRPAYHLDPKSRKPSIEKYFIMPQSYTMQGRKRRRSDVDRMDDGRRVQNPVYA